MKSHYVTTLFVSLWNFRNKCFYLSAKSLCVIYTWHSNFVLISLCHTDDGECTRVTVNQRKMNTCFVGTVTSLCLQTGNAWFAQQHTKADVYATLKMKVRASWRRWRSVLLWTTFRGRHGSPAVSVRRVRTKPCELLEEKLWFLLLCTDSSTQLSEGEGSSN
jgi:hypothetical protein